MVADALTKLATANVIQVLVNAMDGHLPTRTMAHRTSVTPGKANRGDITGDGPVHNHRGSSKFWQNKVNYYISTLVHHYEFYTYVLCDRVGSSNTPTNSDHAMRLWARGQTQCKNSTLHFHPAFAPRPKCAIRIITKVRQTTWSATCSPRLWRLEVDSPVEPPESKTLGGDFPCRVFFSSAMFRLPTRNLGLPQLVFSAR